MKDGATRRVVAALIAALALLLAASPAGAAERRERDRVPANLDQSVETAHFVVHYTTEEGDRNRFSPEQATQAASYAEDAYAKEVGDWGFPAPRDDGDGKTDIYVFYQPDGNGGGFAPPDWPPGPDRTTSAWIELDPRYVSSRWVHMHEFFHVLQFARFTHWRWLTEPTAEWAHFEAVGAAGWPGYLAHSWVPLDCHSFDDHGACEGDSLGYGKWIFFEYLSRRYGGPDFINDIGKALAARGAADRSTIPSGVGALEDVLAAHGSSLTEAYLGYVRSSLARDWLLPGLASYGPQTDVAWTGEQSPEWTVSVDHLSARYLRLYSRNLEPCEPATLRVEVTLPAGLDTTPVLKDYTTGGRGTELMQVEDGVARAELPWSTCGLTADLGLPNVSTTADDQRFVVRTSVEVDHAAQEEPTPATQPASPPPAVVPVREPGVAPDVVPRLRVRLPRTARRGGPIVLNVRASTDGRVEVLVTPGVRRSFDVIRGPNRLTVRLPRSLRAGRHRLVLVPLSPAGTRGERIVGRLRVVPRAVRARRR